MRISVSGIAVWCELLQTGLLDLAPNSILDGSMQAGDKWAVSERSRKLASDGGKGMQAIEAYRGTASLL